MLSGRLTRATLRILDWIAACTLPLEKIAPHRQTGRRGEEAAYFYLRTLGYVMVARNFRSPRRRGEIDLIGWQKNVLCFIEVKTRTSHDVKPAEAAVDQEKQRDVLAVAEEYLRTLAASPAWRLDVLSVYYETGSRRPEFELFQNVLAVS
jgi:putative endonuclease